MKEKKEKKNPTFMIKDPIVTLLYMKNRQSLSIYKRISAAPLDAHIEISASTLISAAPLNARLIRIVTIFY